MHTVFLIVGKSGSGKDSLVSKLCAKYGYSQLKSYATEREKVILTFLSIQMKWSNIGVR